jgi:hypothetical protein
MAAADKVRLCFCSIPSPWPEAARGCMGALVWSDLGRAFLGNRREQDWSAGLFSTIASNNNWHLDL